MRHFRFSFYRQLLSLVFLSGLLPSLGQAAATITINNVDSDGEGFNDTTSFTAQGGNHASTLGQARLNAFQYAANLLAMYIESDVEIQVNAQFSALGGSNPVTLGYAAPYSIHRDFPGAPQANTWYTTAAAEKLAATELNSNVDINATFNSDVDRSDTLAGRKFYYGFDMNAGSDTDFVTVVMHELLHGLGFISLVNLSTGAKYSGYNDAYMRHLERHGSTPSDYPDMSDSERLTASTDTGNLHWTGTNVLNNDDALTDGKSSDHVEMYAPTPVESGSSVSHFSSDVTPNELMEPAYISPLHSPGLAIHLLADVGWSPVNSATGSADLQLAITDSIDPINANNNLGHTVTITNNGTDSAAQTTLSLFIPASANYVAASASQGSCRNVGQIVTCVIGSVASSASATVTLTTAPQQGGDITLAAAVSSITTDSNAANNQMSEVTTVSGIADLQVVSNPSPASVTAGQTLSFVTTITNNGPSHANDVAASLSLPAGTTYIGASPSQGSCSNSGLTVSCSLGRLNSNSEAYITTSVTTTNAGSPALTSTASATEQDSNDSNNSATTSATVEAPPSGGSGGCFIATAAYGSIMARDVVTLRKFRDQYLLTHRAGRWFVANYYRYSPPIADELARSPTMKAVMRGLLFPLVATGRLLTGSL